MNPFDMGLLKKKIKKEKKLEKYLKKKKEEGALKEEEKFSMHLPNINIFEVETYNSGIKTVVNVTTTEEIVNKHGLSDQTSGMFGGNLNL